MQEKIKILKVKFDSTTLDEATKKALALANDKKQHYIATPNPEILLESLKNNKFKKILNKSKNLHIAVQKLHLLFVMLLGRRVCIM